LKPTAYRCRLSRPRPPRGLRSDTRDTGVTRQTETNSP
jgi:hypothetical protein